MNGSTQEQQQRHLLQVQQSLLEKLQELNQQQQLLASSYSTATQQPISLRRETPSPVASYSWTLRRRPHSKRPSGTPPSWGTVKSNSAGNPSAASWTPSQSFSRTLAGGDLSAASRLLTNSVPLPLAPFPKAAQTAASRTTSVGRNSFASLSADNVALWCLRTFHRLRVFTSKYSPPFRACCPLLPATWAQHGVFGAPRRSSRHRQACSGTRALREASRCSSADYSSFEGTLSRRTPESFLTNGHAGGVLTVWREQQPQKQDIDRSARASGGASAQKQTQRHQHRPYKRECCLDAAAASVLHSGTAAAPSCYSFSHVLVVGGLLLVGGLCRQTHKGIICFFSVPPGDLQQAHKSLPPPPFPPPLAHPQSITPRALRGLTEGLQPSSVPRKDKDLNLLLEIQPEGRAVLNAAADKKAQWLVVLYSDGELGLLSFAAAVAAWQQQQLKRAAQGVPMSLLFAPLQRVSPPDALPNPHELCLIPAKCASSHACSHGQAAPAAAASWTTPAAAAHYRSKACACPGDQHYCTDNSSSRAPERKASSLSLSSSPCSSSTLNSAVRKPLHRSRTQHPSLFSRRDPYSYPRNGISMWESENFSRCRSLETSRCRSFPLAAAAKRPGSQEKQLLHQGETTARLARSAAVKAGQQLKDEWKNTWRAPHRPPGENIFIKSHSGSTQAARRFTISTPMSNWEPLKRNQRASGGTAAGGSAARVPAAHRPFHRASTVICNNIDSAAAAKRQQLEEKTLAACRRAANKLERRMKRLERISAHQIPAANTASEAAATCCTASALAATLRASPARGFSPPQSSSEQALETQSSCEFKR
ncbi:hypothetical protein cyc_01570 [Cyclospora cayetanensis]|uniref:Uncharacterized protein n=1 Tax=Cyclospora cayetanensis TaxID=88456 RepID=A0A1D3D326_9EIME|nr:hypothetical protein cyc_01570 [Cyclospora cayetanensis]